ncbi:MAG: cadherin-like domain-containing protein [Planctomycetales bacterium]|nr:cadherin-like domain-containing protein [Planctomycetales bacterium]
MASRWWQRWRTGASGTRSTRLPLSANHQQRRRTLRLVGESLEPKTLLAAIEMTDLEQRLLELVNRARANPTAEAARYGIDLNQDLEPGEISPDFKQPLAPHQALINAARLHSRDMLIRRFFDHVNPDGDGPGERSIAAGYPVGAGENIAWYGAPGTIDRNLQVDARHEALFLSEHHRVNMLTAGYRELGNGIEFGFYEQLSAIMVSEEFGNRGGDVFITGVAYTDLITPDNFYTIGESLSGVTITAKRVRDGQSFTTTTGGSGGYSLQVPTGVYTVTATSTKLTAPMIVNNVVILGANVKVDFNRRVSQVGTIAGIAFEDRNHDGVRNANEPAIADRTFFIDTDDNGKKSPDEYSVVTNASGAFEFKNLPAGSYHIRDLLPTGWLATAPTDGATTVQLLAGLSRTGFAFGSYQDQFPPVAVGDSFTVDGGVATQIDVFANDSDVDGQLQLASSQVHRDPAHGSVAYDPSTKHLVYTPDDNFSGNDSFAYAVVDDDGLVSEAAEVTLVVNPAVGILWQNPTQALDVNNDTHVSPIDALQILNSINSRGARRLAYPTSGAAPPPYYDVNGDSFISPIDALFVLNELNRLFTTQRTAAAVAAVDEASPAAIDQVLGATPTDELASAFTIAAAIDATSRRKEAV